MKILMAASEMAPWVQTGMVAETMANLPPELQKLGHDVGVVLPGYDAIGEMVSTGVEFHVQVGGEQLLAEVCELQETGGPQIFLIRQRELFDRPGIYGATDHLYEDNARRFIFFSKAVVELARRIDPLPEILHVHDWQSALVPVLVHAMNLPVRTVLTMHDAAAQGSFPWPDFGLTNLPGQYFEPSALEYYGNMNLLKGGIVFAHAVVTISDSYKRDVLSARAGSGLEGVLREQEKKVFGFLHGESLEQWSPEHDQHLPKKFRASSLAGRKQSRAALLKKCGLDPTPEGPVFVLTSWGMDDGRALADVLDRLLADDVRLITVKTYERELPAEFAVAARKYHGRYAAVSAPDLALQHLLLAGADAVVLPGGIMRGGSEIIRALRYGAVPVARSTSDVLELVRDVADGGWGFLYHTDEAEGLWDALARVKRMYQEKEEWKHLVRRAMKIDHGPTQSAAAYESIYQQAMRPA